MPHKCPNCKAPDHRPGYCSACMTIFRRVRKWVKAYNGKERGMKSQNTPACTAWWVIEPDAEVRAWLTKRGKMPDLDGRRYEAVVRTFKSLVSGV